VEENRVKVLNVAGPRASNEPDVGEFVMAVLDAVFRTYYARPSTLCLSLQKLRGHENQLY
jgi:hypothetical protein